MGSCWRKASVCERPGPMSVPGRVKHPRIRAKKDPAWRGLSYVASDDAGVSSVFGLVLPPTAGEAHAYEPQA